MPAAMTAGIITAMYMTASHRGAVPPADPHVQAGPVTGEPD